MHPIQEKLLKLSKKENLAKISLRKMAESIGMPTESPQKIKHHLLQLEKKGFLSLDRNQGTMRRTQDQPSWVKGLLKTKSTGLFSIPIVGTANCGPATIFAEENFQGFLKLSSKLVGKNKPDGLFAIKADGSSMNRASIGGKQVDDGDYIIIDREDKDIQSGNVVLVIIDQNATVKRYIDDRANGQIVLKADSSFDYEPIYLHPDDEFSFNGKAIKVIKNPSHKSGISK